MEKKDNNQQPPQKPNERQNLWYEQMEAVRDFKTHQLPLARIKKIMKSDRDVHMIAAEAPMVFAKACEMFINDLTMRSWLHAEENKRRTLQKSDISAAVARSYTFDFLIDVVPKDDSQLDGLVPYYLQPGIVTGNPVAGYSGKHAPPTPGWQWNGDGADEAGHSGRNSGGLK